MSQAWRRGLTAGIPISLGYLSVSFGIGILASRAGFSVGEAVFLSAANLTSAGEAAGIEVIAAAGTVIEIILTQFVINLRYALMSLSLTQKLNKEFTTGRRLLLSYGITDEIFAVASAQPGLISPPFLGGLIAISGAGWVAGTFLGAFAGEILPAALSDALGIMLYGMFIAIVIPVAKRSREVLIVAAASVALSLVIHFLFPAVSSGFSVVICAVAASAAGALLFPVKDEEAGGDV